MKHDPVRAVQLVLLTSDRQLWHAFDGFCVPSAQHAPPITQFPACGTLHASVASSHVVVHASPSSTHGAPATQLPDWHRSTPLQNVPSSHVNVSSFVHDVRLVADRHAWHRFPGFTVPSP
jgi:hypothetical protein